MLDALRPCGCKQNFDGLSARYVGAAQAASRHSASFARSSELSVASFQFARRDTHSCASAATADGASTTVRRQHLSIANGSLAEVDALLVVAHELEYIDSQTLDTVTEEIAEVRRMLHGLLNQMREK